VASIPITSFVATLAAISVAACGLSIQFGGGAPIVDNRAGDANPAAGIIQFAAQNNPGGRAWDATAGLLILNVIPGVSASLTLTGVGGAAFDISFDPAGGAGRFVSIFFDSGAFAPIGPPAFDAASLNGSVISALALADGVRLDAATDAGPFGFVGPFAQPGAFNGAVGPVPDRAPPVVQLIGELRFSFDAAQAAGDRVSLPASAMVRTSGSRLVYEPSSVLLLGIALGVLAVSPRRTTPPVRYT
jgi:hypothetical protein